MDGLWRYLIKRPQLVAILVVLGIAFLPIAVWLDLRRISDKNLRSQAAELNSVIDDIRFYYAKNVIARIADGAQATRALHNYRDVPGAIPIPATLSIELGQIISGRANNIGYRFVSDYPFTSRQTHQLDQFEKAAIAAFRQKGQTKEIISEATGTIFNRRIRAAVPVVMGGACVNCHNSHQESPKRDWKVGDVRGIQIVSIGQSIAGNLQSFQFLIAYLIIAGAIGTTFSALQWRQARTFRQLNGELEEANSFLASISLKISKYLPPQIYKSIFSGEKDTAISTERKKLTIFFSDIKDFTLASETLQPEELTRLLNEYFSEMSKIAAEHGATLDKFIGDAILAFFGDPETKGVKEDARACVKMAIAMQQRIGELNLEWKASGIGRPFLARMGINTGFCNVGNFGSVDRMDYTIIGAEANLAARLESICEPSGIVMSYETYMHVSDLLDAKPLPEIELKGITRDIIPYAAQNFLTSNIGESEARFSKKMPGLSLDIDFEDLGDVHIQDAQSTLEAALKSLRQRSGNGN